MNQAIKERVTIQPGGLIEIRRPELPVGATAEVIVIVNDAINDIPAVSLGSLFGKVRGCFKSGEEADAFIRSEREAWEV